MSNEQWGEFSDVYHYLFDKEYADGITKDQKRRIREKSSSFVIKDGDLLHKGKNGNLGRVIVDAGEKDRLVASLHCGLVGGGHFGMNATIKKLTDRFWWRSISDDARNFVRNCDACQRANASNKAPASTLHPISVKEIFHRWGIDMVGPLTTTKMGNKYLVVATEYLTRWPEAAAVPDKSAEGIHSFLMRLVYRFGACNVLLHDQGREFNNKLVNDLCTKMEISVAMSSAYHPQTNGQVTKYILAYLNVCSLHILAY